MNQQIKRYFLAFTLLLSGTLLTAATTPLFLPRSQSVDSTRELIGLANDFHIHLFDECENYVNMAITAEFQRSFRGNNIAQSLLGSDLTGGCECDTIRVVGSRVDFTTIDTPLDGTYRTPSDWMADYFGLSSNHMSSFTINPRIQNVIVDFNFFVGLNRFAQGLYLNIHAPFVNTRWRLDYDATLLQAGTRPYEPGYFAPNLVATGDLLTSFEEFITGQDTPTLNGGVTFEPLRNSKFGCGTLTKTRLSDIQYAIGYDFIQCDDYHFGVALRGSFPTGNKVYGEYLFEPIVGNGHFYELGAGFTGHWTFWRGCDNDAMLSLWAEGNFTHLFKTTQRRSFDLCNGNNSRYMLAELLGTPVVNNLRGANVTPSAQFKNVFTPVANLTTIDVNVSIPVQSDITILLDYTSCNWSWDIGYNFWGRSCEKISIDCDCPTLLTEQTWALKGDAFVFGFDRITAGTPAVALSATESKATIHGGYNFAPGFVPATAIRNFGIDNPQLATGDASGGIANNILDASPAGVNQTNTSINPVILTNEDINLEGARTKGRTHSFFTNLSYTWADHCEVIPFFGAGFKLEFAPHRSVCNSSLLFEQPAPVCTPSDCGSCTTIGVSQWAIWLRGGLSFN